MFITHDPCVAARLFRSIVPKPKENVMKHEKKKATKTTPVPDRLTLSWYLSPILSLQSPPATPAAAPQV